MKNNKLKFGMILLLGVLLISLSSAYMRTSQYAQSSAYSSSLGLTWDADSSMCEAGQDFIIQIAPFGCTPAVVRSDLLEEQNVPVFCQLGATKINPLIDIEAIDYLSFSGKYPKEISGVGFHPAQAALGFDKKIGSPVLDNIGYVVIVLKKQDNVSEMPDFVQGNLTAKIRYDIENAYGIGKASFYLPELEESEWEQNKIQYGFWDSRAYLRTESVGIDSAKIGVYDDMRRIKIVELKKAQTSDEIFLPGFDCLAGLRLRLDGFENPDTRAKLEISGEIVEVAKGEKFLDNRCWITNNIEKKGDFQKIKIKCHEDDGWKTFDLSISPNVEIQVNGEAEKRSVGVGGEIKIGDKTYYLGKIDSKTNDNVYIEICEDKDCLKKDKTPIKKDEKDKTVNKIKVEFLGFPEFIDDKTKITDTNKEDYTQAIKDYETIINSFAHEKYPENSAETIGETAFFNAINLANSLSQMKKVSELCNDFKSKFPDSKYIKGLYDYGGKCTEVQLVNSGKIDMDVVIDGVIKNIQLKDIYEPGFEDFGAVVSVQGEGKFELMKNEIKHFPNSDSPEYIQLLDISDAGTRSTTTNEYKNSVKIKVNLNSNEEGKFIEGIYTLNQDVANNFNSATILKLEEINLKKSAKVSVIPSIRNAETEANFSFKIGIEQRTIKLSPEKTKEKIDNLNKTIKDWEDKSEKLGNVVKGLKGACLATGAFLTVKNFFSNTGGKAIARQDIMKNVWEKKCTDAIKSGTISYGATQNKPVTYKTLAECYNDNSKNIDSDVDSRAGIIEAQNKGIKESQQECQAETTNWFGERTINDEKFMKCYTARVQKCLTDNNEKIATLTDPYSKKTDKEEDKKTLDVNEDLINKLNIKYWEKGVYSIEELRDIELACMSLEKGDSSLKELNEGNLYTKLNEVDNYAEKTEKASSLNDKLKENKLGISASRTFNKDASKGFYDGGQIEYSQINCISSNSNSLTNVVSTPANAEIPFNIKYQDDNLNINLLSNSNEKKCNFFEDGKSYNAKIEPFEDKNYLVILTKNKGDEYSIDKVFEIIGEPKNNQLNIKLANEEASKNIPNKISYTKIDKDSYNNVYLSSRGESTPCLRYYETEPYKGLPAVIPFDLKNGWYVYVAQTLPITGNIASYEASGRVSSFWICNVGKNQIEERKAGDDICELITSVSGQPKVFPELGETEAALLIKRANDAVNAASNIRNKKIGETVKISSQATKVKICGSAADVPEMQCYNFMSPSDCKLLFNLCDPVVCPSSRCNYGGTYYVKDVIQSGFIGSALLCLPNYRQGIYIPVCLSGIKAAIDGWISVLKSHRDCLQESLDTGKMIGICDEIYGIHACEFFWRQSLPLVNLIIPKTMEWVLGQNVNGGGEYLGVASAWENAQNSINYFTNYYAANAYKAFKARTAESVGDEVCKNYASVVYPDGGNILDALTDPDSPPQFHGRFDEISFTTATNPPISQYKVYYHIYAGEDSRAYYNVYLKGDSGDSLYQDTANRRIVASGYIATGEYASETKDFTAPSGYKELCINVNGQEECGFKQVSTSFAVDWVKDQYIKEQAGETNVKTEKECVSGSSSLYSLITPSIEGAADEMINPAIYERGIIRICATANPGKGTGTSRWTDVGYCGDSKIRCWLDSESVKNAVEFNKTAGDILKDVQDDFLDKLKDQEGYHKNPEQKIKDLGDLSADQKILKIDKEFIAQFFFNNEQAKVRLIKADAYAKLATPVENKQATTKEGATNNNELTETATESKESNCQLELGNKIIEIAQEIKTQNSQIINEATIKQKTSAENFKCLVLQIAMQESNIQHCIESEERKDNCLYCDDNSKNDEVLKGSDEKSTGIMQINLDTHPSMKDKAYNFEENVRYGIEYLIKGYDMNTRQYNCGNKLQYSGWERALRIYNGWNTNCNKGNPYYVEEVLGEKIRKLESGATQNVSQDVRDLFPELCGGEKFIKEPSEQIVIKFYRDSREGDDKFIDNLVLDIIHDCDKISYEIKEKGRIWNSNLPDGQGNFINNNKGIFIENKIEFKVSFATAPPIFEKGKEYFAELICYKDKEEYPYKTEPIKINEIYLPTGVANLGDEKILTSAEQKVVEKAKTCEDANKIFDNVLAVKPEVCEAIETKLKEEGKLEENDECTPEDKSPSPGVSCETTSVELDSEVVKLVELIKKNSEEKDIFITGNYLKYAIDVDNDGYYDIQYWDCCKGDSYIIDSKDVLVISPSDEIRKKIEILIEGKGWVGFKDIRLDGIDNGVSDTSYIVLNENKQKVINEKYKEIVREYIKLFEDKEIIPAKDNTKVAAAEKEEFFYIIKIYENVKFETSYENLKPFHYLRYPYKLDPSNSELETDNEFVLKLDKATFNAKIHPDKSIKKILFRINGGSFDSNTNTFKIESSYSELNPSLLDAILNFNGKEEITPTANSFKIELKENVNYNFILEAYNQDDSLAERVNFVVKKIPYSN